MTPLKWVKKGLLFEPSGRFEWQFSHASHPLPDKIGDHRYRIYFGSRNKYNRTQIGYVEADFSETGRVISVSENPVLSLGHLGAFDDSAVFPSSIITVNGKKYLYYVGSIWGTTVPHYSALGLAVSDDGGRTFERFSSAPILERNDVDPFMVLSAWVAVEDSRWRIWYTSCVDWRVENRKPKPIYHIKYAESGNGVNWVRNGTVCIDFEYDDEWAIARPCVIPEGGFYRMWYCYARGNRGYRIGYAESSNGINWKRKDREAGIDVSQSGWDSEIIAYPSVLKFKDEYLMLYNGNGFGRDGFGYATATG